MTIAYDKKKTCCFTGHRQIAQDKAQSLRKRIDKTIETLADEGITTFISGGALGFDIMAAKAVLKAKEKHPGLRLIMAIPCRDQHAGWHFRERREYAEILKVADDVYCLNEKYCTGCMHQRNRFMVKNSTICVAFFDGSRGGTAHTINLAKEEGLRIVNLAGQIVTEHNKAQQC